jgi:hypothetical protein
MLLLAFLKTKVTRFVYLNKRFILGNNGKDLELYVILSYKHIINFIYKLLSFLLYTEISFFRDTYKMTLWR